MSKSNKTVSSDHDSHGGKQLTPQEAVEAMGEDGFKAVEEYRKNPNPDTYFGYRDTLAKYESLVTGEKYVRPRKYHDIPMSDIYMKHNQSRNLNFYVGVLSRFKRKCLWSIPTLQVGVDKASYYFGYHPEFYKYYPVEACLYFLQHEAVHILQEHIPRLMKLYNAVRPLDIKKPTQREMEAIEKLQTYTNIAADEATNSILNHNGAFKNLDKSDFINPADYGHLDRWSYEEYLNSWMLGAYSLFQKKSDGSGSTGMGAGHASMEEAMGQGSGEGEPQDGGGSGDDTQDQVDKDFKDTTGSNGHTWIEDIQNGKSGEPSEAEKDKIEKAQKEAKEKGIPISEAMKDQEGEGEGEGGDKKRDEPTASELNDLADSLAKQSERALIDTVRDHKERGGGRGTIPGEYMEKYDELTKICEMHWTEIFESIISDPKEVKETFRINKYNRNTILLGKKLGKTNQYGFKEDDPKYRIWVSIDTSGSMGRDDIMEGLAVIKSVQKSNEEIEVTVCEFDTSIHRITEMDQDSDLLKDVMGRGGTDFNAIFRHLDEEVPDDRKPDLHIVFTDGGAPPPDEDVRIPVHQMPLLWVLTSGYPSDWFFDGYGEIIETKPNSYKQTA